MPARLVVACLFEEERVVEKKKLTPKLTEKTISVRIPIEAKELIGKLCYEEIDGVQVKAKTESDIAREALIKGLREMLKERGII